MRAYDIILKKRNNQKLSKEEINFLIFRYNNGDIPDYQMSAFLMSVFLNGMDDEEIFLLTDAMISSGDKLDLSFLDLPTADKHSTGGVGDGTSLIVAPVVASLGICVPMIARRGLGYTGGTLDKLESIPGFRTNIDEKEFLNILNLAGVAIIGQNFEMVPVDKKMYALRDSTATVESIPLISASIMSKKIAEGVKTLVLDVKSGNGAFMKKESEAKDLAQKMINIGKKFGLNVSAVVTDMNAPLGDCVGNSLEIKQTIEILKGNLKNDLSELSLYLSALMILNSKKASTLEEGKSLAQKQIDNKKALEKFKEIIRLQGGKIGVIDNPDAVLPKAKCSREIKATESGYISNIDTRSLGMAEMLTGAGRDKKEDKIDYSSGIIFHKKLNDYVEKGKLIAELMYNSSNHIDEAEMLVADAYIISKIEDKNINMTGKVYGERIIASL
ncbi:MAG: thymidine phosphorylase [Clostridiales Family XIII bacterium]|jgi:pyrimidine-nucleoside phosphorylase|nr:thymidine phosphorylase [Clostridiales Family XIII bacterium]